MRSALILLLLLSFPVAATAKPIHADPSAKEARAAYEEGTTEYNLAHYAEALAAFERGYRIKSDPAFLFNIAQAHRQLHHPRDAAASYRAYLRESPNVNDAKRAEIEHLITSMDEETARAAAAASQPPTGVTAPAEPVAPPAVVEAPPPPPPKKKRTALWIGIGVGAGVVVAGLAIGLGIGLSQASGSPSTSLGNMSVTFR